MGSKKIWKLHGGFCLQSFARHKIMGIQIVNQMFHHFIFIKQQGPTDKNWHKLVFDVTASRFTN